MQVGEDSPRPMKNFPGCADARLGIPRSRLGSSRTKKKWFFNDGYKCKLSFDWALGLLSKRQKAAFAHKK